jgi:hypothetical protein
MTSSHATLHPLRKLERGRPRLIGRRKDGRPIYAMAGGAPDAMLERLTAEREQCLARVKAVTDSAAEADRTCPTRTRT